MPEGRAHGKDLRTIRSKKIKGPPNSAAPFTFGFIWRLPRPPPPRFPPPPPRPPRPPRRCLPPPPPPRPPRGPRSGLPCPACTVSRLASSRLKFVSLSSSDKSPP